MKTIQTEVPEQLYKKALTMVKEGCGTRKIFLLKRSDDF